MKFIFYFLFVLVVGISAYWLMSCSSSLLEFEEATCGKLINDVYFGVSGVEYIDKWCNDGYQGCSGCYDQPSDFPTDELGRIDLFDLVNEDYNSYDDDKFWFQYGGNGQQYCVDDEIRATMHGADCLVLPDMPTDCVLTIWIQLLSECDQCVEGQQGGTWWKWEKEFGADELPISLCGKGTTGSLIELELKNDRTSCPNLVEDWGCGAGESQ